MEHDCGGEEGIKMEELNTASLIVVGSRETENASISKLPVGACFEGKILVGSGAIEGVFIKAYALTPGDERFLTRVSPGRPISFPVSDVSDQIMNYRPVNAKLILE
jgi:hypothetical protein